MTELTYDLELGPRTYGRRPATYGVAVHTTEGADSSRASAMGTINQQRPGGGLWAGGGSYTFIVNDEDPILTVPYLEAAGGISGDHTPPDRISPITGRAGTWAPDRFPWLQQMLPAAAYADPNAYLLQVAISGKTGQLMGYPNVDKLATDVARIIAWAEEQPEIADNLVVMGHLNWQADRSDPGQPFIDLAMAKYVELTAPPPTIPAGPQEPTEPPAITPPPVPQTREARLASEVIRLRAAHPAQAHHWANSVATQALDGTPLLRETRLAGEALYLRRVATGTDAPTT